ncbi:MAG: hypothetical protein IPM82_21805 [Saprospiraceae bacterium]|nr:hypothetical protein [Saprospiraceae bacterium]
MPASNGSSTACTPSATLPCSRWKHLVGDQRGTMSVFVEAAPRSALRRPNWSAFASTSSAMAGSCFGTVRQTSPTVASIKSQIVDDYNSMGSNAVFLW